jgi:hypothetical protein
MAREIDYNAYSPQKREQVLQLVYDDLGVSPKTGWVKFQSRGGKMGLAFADDLGFWLASSRNLTPVEAGAEDTGSSFRAWATLVSPTGQSSTGEALVAKTSKRLDALRATLKGAVPDDAEALVLGGDWISTELQRGLQAGLAGAPEEEIGTLTAALARILDGAQKKGDARNLVLELLPGTDGLDTQLDAARGREQFREMASQQVGALAARLRSSQRQDAVRTLLLAVAKTVEDLDTRALALDRAKARAAIDLCKGRIVKGNKRADVVIQPAPAVSEPVVVATKPAPVGAAAAKPAAPTPTPERVAASAPAGVVAPVVAKPAARPEEPKVTVPAAAAAKPAPAPSVAKPEAAKAKPAAASAKTAKPASVRQQAYVRDLMRKAGVKPENTALRMAKLVGTAKRIEELNASEAATAIDKLNEVLKKKRVAV